MIHMKSASGVIVSAQETFGRDGAMFESLLGFVAQLSVVLWGLVILTAVMRSIGIRVYRRGVGRASVVEPSEPRSATAADSGLVHLGLLAPATKKETGYFQGDQQQTGSAVPSAEAREVTEAASEERPEPRSAPQIPAFAGRTEA